MDINPGQNSEFKPLYDRFGPNAGTGPFRRMPIEQHIDYIVADIKEQLEGVVSVVYLDIDGYSHIETQYGYDLADALLEEIESELHEVDGPELTARYVRDSFLLVYNGYSLEETFFEAEKVRRDLSGKTFDVMVDEKQRSNIEVKLSAGVATFPGEVEDRGELIGLAESAARQAYQAGGDKMMFGRASNLVPKTSHYIPSQLERLREVGKTLSRSDASLLREALDDLLRKYDQRNIRRRGEVETEG